MTTIGKRAARRLIAPGSFLLVLAGGFAAQAESIPPQVLETDHRTCLASCTAHGGPTERCTPYCDCSVKKVGEQITLEEYQQASLAIAQNQPPPAATLDKMKAIAKSCKAETP